MLAIAIDRPTLRYILSFDQRSHSCHQRTALFFGVVLCVLLRQQSPRCQSLSWLCDKTLKRQKRAKRCGAFVVVGCCFCRRRMSLSASEVREVWVCGWTWGVRRYRIGFRRSGVIERTCLLKTARAEISAGVGQNQNKGAASTSRRSPHRIPGKGVAIKIGRKGSRLERAETSHPNSRESKFKGERLLCVPGFVWLL